MEPGAKKEKCRDCEQCQMCSEARCRLCRKEGGEEKLCRLSSSFTYEEYLKWKQEKGR